MKIYKNIIGIVFVIGLLFGSFSISSAAFPYSYTNWVNGSLITSAWLNAVEQFLVSSTSPLGSIFNQATTTGNILIASSSVGWSVLPVGANGKVLTASSTASRGVSWESAASGGFTNAATSTASGAFTVATTTSLLTITIPSNLGFFTNDSNFITASTTNLSASGFLQGATSNISGQSALTSVSSTNQTLTGYFVGTTISSTNINASGYGTFPTLNFTNASGSNLTLSGNLQATTLNITSFANSPFIVSGTASTTIKGDGTVSTLNNILYTNASGTNESVTGYGLFPTLNFTNSSGTSLTAATYIQTPQANLTNVSSTRIDATTGGTIANVSSTNITISTNSQLGTVKSGTWNGTVVATNYGGTNTASSPAFGSLLVGNGTTQYGILAVATNGSFLIASSTATLGVAWETLPGGTNCLDEVGGIIGVTGSGDCATLGGANKFIAANQFTVSVSSTAITVKGDTVSTSTPANPSATIGTSAVNGTANTFLRSDGSPALGTQFASSSITFNIYDATTTSPYSYAKWRANKAVTLQQVSCDENAAATTTMEIYKVTAGLNSIVNGGTFLSSMNCGISGNTQNTSGTNTMAVGDFLIVNATSMTGVPKWTTATIYFQIN